VSCEWDGKRILATMCLPFWCEWFWISAQSCAILVPVCAVFVYWTFYKNLQFHQLSSKGTY